MKVIGKQRNSKMCFICGMDNPIGLRAQFYNMEDGSVICPFRYTENDQSYPGRVHGGLIAAMLDELGLRALWSDGDESTFGVTMSIHVKYRRPVPYDADLYGRGIVTKESGTFCNTHAGIYDAQGSLLSEAEIKYIKLAPEAIAPDADVHEEMCYLVEDDVREINVPFFYTSDSCC